MSDDEELFTHTVTAWTVGDLRKALEGVPDEFPLVIIPADKPENDLAAEEQVVVGAGSEGSWKPAAGTTGPPDHFQIAADFPSGQYYRRTR
jgi:hypothetical protein